MVAVEQLLSLAQQAQTHGDKRQDNADDRLATEQAAGDNQTPEQRIKELEQQLALMSQKAQFFEAVVDVLKNDYGVAIVKKRPGKSSRSGKSRG